MTKQIKSSNNDVVKFATLTFVVLAMIDKVWQVITKKTDKGMVTLQVPTKADSNKIYSLCGNKQIIAVTYCKLAILLGMDIITTSHAVRQYLAYCGMHTFVNDKADGCTKDMDKNSNRIYITNASKGIAGDGANNIKWVNTTLDKMLAMDNDAFAYMLTAFATSHKLDIKATKTKLVKAISKGNKNAIDNKLVSLAKVA